MRTRTITVDSGKRVFVHIKRRRVHDAKFGVTKMVSSGKHEVVELGEVSKGFNQQYKTRAEAQAEADKLNKKTKDKSTRDSRMKIHARGRTPKGRITIEENLDNGGFAVYQNSRISPVFPTLREAEDWCDDHGYYL